RIELPPEPRRLDERLELRGEEDAVIGRGVVERLDTYGIAREDEIPPLHPGRPSRGPAVVDREREDRVEVREHVEPACRVEMEQHFGVGGAVKAMSGGLQLRPQGA